MPRVLMLFLVAFRSTGGIEKMNRTLLRVLADWEETGAVEAIAASPYSTYTDPRYFPESKLHGYQGRRFRFMLDMLRKPWFKTASGTNILFCTHINLAPAAWILKLRYPNLKIVLLAHGIEVWRPLSGLKRWLIRHTDKIIAVSQFTAAKVKNMHDIPANKITVVPNCLDPFFKPPVDLNKPGYLLQRYGLIKDQPVLLCISRLNEYEVYKGYDKIIESLPELVREFPNIKLLLGGQYVPNEKKRLEALIDVYGLNKHVRLVGFIRDEELIDHYRLADVFVMPSKKEGFGLVFIEAMACGTPAIGGNVDGSSEALRPGKLGTTVNPDDACELSSAIKSVLHHKLSLDEAYLLQRGSIQSFGYSKYKEQLQKALIFD